MHLYSAPMKSITTRVHTFEGLIDGGFLYIDKTAALRELIRPGKSRYFLSRPRHFGKSLLVSTLKAVFQGRRDLFEGLALGSADYDWPVHPVIHLDLRCAVAETAEDLDLKLRHIVDRNAEEYGIELQNTDGADRFLELVKVLHDRQGPVVVLVDEYDQPLLDHLGHSSVLPIQNLLKQFYAVIKSTELLQRFALLTGVSPFAKLSVFSELNALTDLSRDPRAATLLGFTREELDTSFPNHIARLADRSGKSADATLEALSLFYNGTRFHPNAPMVYNPVSVMEFIEEPASDERRTLPGLYLVGTPIGNLEDMSLRGIRTLNEVDFLLAEDTRKTGILLRHYAISKPMISCHEFNEASRGARVVEAISAGQAVALVSDAGMPLISDPGYRIVQAVREAGLRVTAIPGPTALTTAVALSGWGGDGFVFTGFPPNKGAGRRRLLESLREEARPVVLYESTHRIEKLMTDIDELLGDRPVFFGRELTKKFETLQIGTAAELGAFLKNHSSKGEFVVILGPLLRQRPERRQAQEK